MCKDMRKALLLMMTAIVLVSCSENKQEDEFNITDKFVGTLNIYEKYTKNGDGSITYSGIPWGGLVGVMREHNLPVDWSKYESITFEFAEPTKVETQILVSDRLKTWGRAGITSLTCFFNDQDVSFINEVTLQLADSATITVKKVRLSPLATNWASTTAWEGDCSFGNWEDGFFVSQENFENLVEGDKLEFIFTTDQSDPSITYWLFKTIYAGTENTLEGNYIELNKWGCAVVGRDATVYRISLTANDIAMLKKNGLYVNGFYNRVTQCNLLRKMYKEVQTEDNTANESQDNY